MCERRHEHMCSRENERARAIRFLMPMVARVEEAEEAERTHSAVAVAVAVVEVVLAELTAARPTPV